MLKSFSKTLGGFSRQPRIVVGAFGKHPAWDDHIDDLGLITDELVQARRQLYAECIAGCIDSGEWGKPDQPPPAWLRDYGHVFLWRTEGTILAGRLWPSRDGRKRTKFPMIVVAQCDMLPLSFIATVVLPALESLQQDCMTQTTQDGVRAVVEGCQRKLETMLSAAAVAPSDEAELAPAVGRLLKSPIGEGDRTSLLRVLYQIEREMGAFIVADHAKGKSISTQRGQHLRAPAGVDSPVDSLLIWTRLLSKIIAPEASLMVLRALDQPWVDAIVGELTPSLLFPIRASAEQSPPASEVPYTLNEAFVRKSQAQLDSWAGRAATQLKPITPAAAASPVSVPTTPSNPASTGINVSPAPAPVPAPAVAAAPPVPPRVQPTASPAPQAHSESTSASGNSSGGKGKLIAAGVIGVVAIALILAISGVLSSGDKPKTTQPPAPTPPIVDAKPKTTSDAPVTPNKPVDPPKVVDATPDKPVEPPPIRPIESLADPRPTWTGPTTIADLQAKARDLQAVAPQAAEPVLKTLASIAADVAAIVKSPLTPETAPTLPAKLKAIDERLAVVSTELDRAREGAKAAAAALAGKFPDRASESEELNTIWSLEMEKVKGLSLTPERAARLTTLLGLIQTTDRALTHPKDLNYIPGPLGEALKVVATRRRAEAITACAKILQEPRADFAAAEPELRGASVAYTNWCEASTKLSTAEHAASMAISAGLAYSDMTPAGSTLSQLHESLKGPKWGRDVVAAVKPTLDELDELANISKAAPREAVLQTLQADAKISRIKTALDRLIAENAAATASGWPASLAELKQAATTLPSLRARLDPARVKSVTEAIGAGWLKQWQSGAAGTTRAELIPLIAPSGINPAQLPKRVAFDIARINFEAALGALGDKPDDASVQKLIGEFVAAAEPTADADPARVAAIASLKALLNTPTQPKLGPADFPPAQAGESRASGKAIGDIAADGTITYELAAEGLPPTRVSFAPVVVGGKTIFVSTTEVSVGLAANILSLSNRADKFREFSPAAEGASDERLGVRTWKAAPKSPAARKGAIVPSTGASANDLARGWFPIGSLGSRVPEVLADPNAVPPDWSSPIDHVSPEAGMLIATAVGCRFPTVEEWKAAVAAEQANDQAPGTQLRGKLWRKQFDIVKQARAAGVLAKDLPSHSAGICWPKDLKSRPGADADDKSLDIDTPAIFFASVGEGPGRVFKHLYGNVAEFVLTDPMYAESLKYLTLKERDLSKAQDLRVVGGSGLSNPSVKRDEAFVPDGLFTPKGFSDVGFRLAFSSDRGLAQQVLGKKTNEVLATLPK